MDRRIGGFQQPLGPFNLKPGDEDGEILPGLFRKYTAEIAGADVAQLGHLLQAEVFMLVRKNVIKRGLKHRIRRSKPPGAILISAPDSSCWMD